METAFKYALVVAFVVGIFLLVLESELYFSFWRLAALVAPPTAAGAWIGWNRRKKT